MATERAIDKLKKAFSVDNKSSYEIYKNGQVILKVYWTPLTIADRDTINTTLIKANRGQEEGSLDFALQVIIGKAEDETGNKLFTEADRASLRREIPLSVLLELMTKMQELGEEATPNAVKAELKKNSYLHMQFFIAEKLGMTLVEIRNKMSLEEMYGWNAYFNHKAEQEEKAYEDAKRKAQTRKVR